MVLNSVLYILGVFLNILAASMVFPILADLVAHNSDWQAFALSSFFTMSCGTVLMLANKQKDLSLDNRQAFVLITLSWLAIALFASLPFIMSDLEMSFTDAFFESMSGITTTGSTVISNLDLTAPGILLWRALLQWLGGIGIIVMAISVLPMLKVGGMQLFKLESSENEKVTPRATEMIKGIVWIYLFATLACAIMYKSFGMSGFDAIAHSMTTISMGGFSTHDTSLGYFESDAINYIACAFMVMAALPFAILFKAMHGKFSLIWTDTQVRGLMLFLSVGLSLVLLYAGYIDKTFVDHDFSEVVFSGLSILTGTGYSVTDYTAWGPFIFGLLFFAMCVGGCAGSAGCGLKVFRIQVLYLTAVVQLKKLVYPNGVFIPHYNGRKLDAQLQTAVMAFVFTYFACLAVTAILLFAIGIDFETALSGAMTAISNVGPGHGDFIGPSGNFAPIPDAGKWVLCAAMLLGRLELFTVLVLFTPFFWRR